jgi:hypothetical protein
VKIAIVWILCILGTGPPVAVLPTRVGKQIAILITSSARCVRCSLFVRMGGPIDCTDIDVSQDSTLISYHLVGRTGVRISSSGAESRI